MGSSDLRLSTSILCVAEFVVGAEAREEKLLRDWIDAGDLEVIGLDEVEDAYRAARFRKKQGLTLPDAFILASVFRLRAHFLTNDGNLLKKAKPLVEATDPIGSAAEEKIAWAFLK
ncbi:MAG: PIN domain-containing protein [Deltaproteobacteria bacterium]|nr:PIN domain-containing protein [Deltaproteobacteria bacterium]